MLFIFKYCGFGGVDGIGGKMGRVSWGGKCLFEGVIMVGRGYWVLILVGFDFKFILIILVKLIGY